MPVSNAGDCFVDCPKVFGACERVKGDDGASLFGVAGIPVRQCASA